MNQYLPYYQNYQPQTQDERIWVQGATSAEAYLVAPNGFVRLWDSSEPVFYEKRADAAGRPYPLEIYEYKRRDNKAAVDYRDEIENLKMRLAALENGGNKNVSKPNANDDGISEV